MKPGDDHTPTWAKALPVSEYAPTPNVIPVARLWQMYEAAQRCTRCGNNQVCRCFEPIGDQPVDNLRRLTPCMGGWCSIRAGCLHYTDGDPDPETEPAERLCVRGQDGTRRPAP